MAEEAISPPDDHEQRSVVSCRRSLLTMSDADSESRSSRPIASGESLRKPAMPVISSAPWQIEATDRDTEVFSTL